MNYSILIYLFLVYLFLVYLFLVYLCYGNRIYECGWSLKDESFAVDAKNGVIVGSWACSLNAGSWKIAGKTLDSAEVNYFANSAYKYMLNRSIDQSGLTYWVGQLNKGASRASVAKALINSGKTPSF